MKWKGRDIDTEYILDTLWSGIKNLKRSFKFHPVKTFRRLVIPVMVLMCLIDIISLSWGKYVDMSNTDLTDSWFVLYIVWSIVWPILCYLTLEWVFKQLLKVKNNRGKLKTQIKDITRKLKKLLK
jgi:hypothetical protein|tara:strand:- start:2263 stop:2637 length:375 start_codon:yes stop_codon:yes gene_type:complete